MDGLSEESFVVFSFCTTFDPSIAIILSLIAGVLTKCAFHEDGLADVVDGFGGVWTKQRILEIMKDSRVGAYGAISIALVVLLKYAALNTLTNTFSESVTIGLMFISYHSLARFTAMNLIFTSSYSRDDQTSKVKPIAKSFGFPEIFGGYFLDSAYLFYRGSMEIYSYSSSFYTLSFFKNYFEKKIRHTGDV